MRSYIMYNQSIIKDTQYPMRSYILYIQSIIEDTQTLSYPMRSYILYNQSIVVRMVYTFYLHGFFFGVITVMKHTTGAGLQYSNAGGAWRGRTEYNVGPHRTPGKRHAHQRHESSFWRIACHFFVVRGQYVIGAR